MLNRKRLIHRPARRRFLLKSGGLLLWVLVLALLTTPARAIDNYRMEDNAIRHFRQGQKWMAVRQYTAAIREFQIGIRLKPDAPLTASLYNNMGLAYLQVGESQKALVSFQQATRLDPEFGLYYQNLARAYTRTDKLDKAAMQLKRATASQNGTDARAWYLLAQLYKEQGNTAAAHDALGNVVRLAPASALAEAARAQQRDLSFGSQTGAE